MNEHISYAMRNQEATGSLLFFNSPGSLLDWSHIVVECIFVVGAILTIIHAVKYYRKNGSPSALYTLLGAFLYGLVMDILSYYTVESFWHGEFSVMLLYNRLPLYIVFLYPTLIYHIFMTIRRYNFTPLIEALSVGFFGGLMYMIFDNIGPQVGWWIWDLSAPSNLPYISNVPLTSYGWFFLFTGAFAWLARTICWRWVQLGQKKWMILTGVLTLPISTILLGTLLFVPYSALAKNVLPWSLMGYKPSLGLASAVHAISYFCGGVAFLYNYRKPGIERDKLLMLFPLIYLCGLLFIYLAKFSRIDHIADGLSLEPLAAGNPVVIIIAIIASFTILLLSHPTSPRNKI